MKKMKRIAAAALSLAMIAGLFAQPALAVEAASSVELSDDSWVYIDNGDGTTSMVNPNAAAEEGTAPETEPAGESQPALTPAPAPTPAAEPEAPVEEPAVEEEPVEEPADEPVEDAAAEPTTVPTAAPVVDAPVVEDSALNATATTVSIHFLKPTSWGDTINAWVWTNTDGTVAALPGYEQYNQTWPGVAVSENAAHDGWYDFAATTDGPQDFYFIFNDGNGYQTADLYTGAVTASTELWVVNGTVYTTAQWDNAGGASDPTASDFGWRYEFVDATKGTIRLMGANTLPSGDVVLPKSVDGNTVVEIVGVGTLFRYNDQVTSVVIPEGYTTIGVNAFRECPNLTSVSLPSTLTSVGNYAFAYNTALTNVTMADGLTTTGNHMFRGCTALTSVTVPGSLNNMGTYLFYQCTGLKEVTLGEGLPALGRYMFRGCTALASITLPESVTSIADYAFYQCSALTQIDLSHVTSIDFYAFRQTGLTEVVLPALEFLGDRAFYGCQSLTKVTLTGDIKVCEGYIFQNCGSLATVVVNEGVTAIGDGMFCNLYSLTSVTLPSTLKRIGADAFSRCESLSMTLPDGLEYLGDYALNGCMAMTIDKLPSSLKYLGAYNLQNLAGVGENILDLPTGLEELGESALSSLQISAITLPAGLKVIGNYALAYNELTAITIPEGVTTIGNEAFAGNDVTTLHFPASVTSIGYAPASGSIEAYTVATGNTSYKAVGGVLFSYDGTTLVSYPRAKENSNNSYTIPSGTTTVGARAFYNVNSIYNTLTIPASVTYIDSTAFMYARNMTFAVDSASTSYAALDGALYDKGITTLIAACSIGDGMEVPSTVTALNDYVFTNNYSLTWITLPDGLKTIGDHAFHYCERLETITIPDSVTKIGELAFYGCSALTNVKLSANLAEMGSQAFGRCTALTTVVLPYSLTEIPEMAFYCCTSLQSVFIPATVTYLGYNLFDRCDALTNVYYGGTEDQWAELLDYSDWNEKLQDGSVTVTYNYSDSSMPTPAPTPAPTPELYKSYKENGWTGYYTESDGYTGFRLDSYTGTLSGEVEMPDYLLYPEYPVYWTGSSNLLQNGEGITKLTLPENLLRVSMDFDYYNPNLTEITIPAGITAIGNYCFEEFDHTLTVNYGGTKAQWLALRDVTNGNDALYLATVNCSDGTLEFTLDWTYTENADGTLTLTGISNVFLPEEVTLPTEINGKKVTKIGELAFAYMDPTEGETELETGLAFCEYVRVLYIPEGYTTIGRAAFGYANLDTLYLPESLTTIEAYAMAAELYHIYYPGTAEEWAARVTVAEGNEELTGAIEDGEFSFDGAPLYGDVWTENGWSAEYYGYSSSNNGFVICGYPEGLSGAVTLPSSMQGYPVTGVTYPKGADYSRLQNVTEITVPEGYNTLYSDAFMGLTGLTTVNLPDTLESIQSRVFKDCTALARIDLPEELDNLYSEAFMNSGLTSIHLPKGLSYLSDGQFRNCEKLTTITLAEGNPNLSVRDGMLFNGDGTYLYCCPEGLGLTSVTVPEGVTYVYPAFADMQNLTEVKLPSTLKYVFSEAFENCTGLSSITLPAKVTSVGSYSFRGCSALEYIVLPAALTNVEYYAFTNCSSLTTVYYGGTETQKANITISSGNEALKNATWVCGATGPAVDIEDFGWSLDENGTLVSISMNGNVMEGELTLPAELNGVTITGIGTYVFANQTGLTKVVLPDTVTTVGERSFEGCTGLQSVVMPAGLTTIGDLAFRGCINMASFEIPAGVTSIGMAPWAGCLDMTLTVAEGNTGFAMLYANEYDIEGTTALYTADGKTLVFAPQTSASTEVLYVRAGTVSIADGACYEMDNLIGLAFNETQELDPETGYVTAAYQTVTTIGSYAFYGTDLNNYLMLPATVTSIGSYAFAGLVYDAGDEYYPGLNKLYLPDSLSTIGAGVFCNSAGMDDLSASGLTGMLDLRDLAITVIPNKAFAGTAYSSVYLSDKVTEIGMDAFAGCDNLTEVYYAGTQAQWKQITIDESNTQLLNATVYYEQGIEWNIDANGVLTVSGKGPMKDYHATANYYAPWYEAEVEDTVTAIVVESGVTTISDSAFYSCQNAASVSIANTVVSIGSNAFNSCWDLDNVVIPNSVTHIGDTAFYYATGLTNITLPEYLDTIPDHLFGGCTKLLKVAVPEGVTEIGEYAFEGCTALTTVTLPSTLTYIGFSSFADCSALTAIEIPAGVTTIYNYAFENCTSLATLTLHEGLEVIGYQAFYKTSSMGDVVLPSTLTELGDEAFMYSGVTSINIPAGITELGDSTFESCRKLASITLPEGLTTLGYSCLEYCDALLEVTIPSTVTDLENYCLASSAGMIKVTFTGPAPTYISSIAFRNLGMNSQATVLYPAKYYSSWSNVIGSVYGANNMVWEAYGDGAEEIPDNICGDGVSWTLENGELVISGTGEGTMYDFNSASATPWYAERDTIKTVVVENGVTYIGDYAFEGLTNLTGFTFPASVYGLGAYVFKGCTGLKTIVMPDTITEMNVGCFYGCTGLTSATLSKGATAVNGSMFEGCTSLAAIEIPDNYIGVDSGAFSGCTSLKRVELPASLYRLQNQAFAYCTGLEEIVMPADMRLNQSSIGSDLFAGCTKLTSITLPACFTVLQNQMFFGCTALKEVNLPEGMTTIGSGAFYGCTSLTSLTLPSTVTSLKYGVFEGSGVAKLYFTGDAPSIASNTMSSMTATCYYPAGNETWTEDVMQQYGGTITWTAYGEAPAAPGDVNDNGTISVLDGLKMANAIAGKIELSAREAAAADVNADGSVNVADLTLLMKYITGELESLS